MDLSIHITNVKWFHINNFFQKPDSFSSLYWEAGYKSVNLVIENTDLQMSPHLIYYFNWSSMQSSDQKNYREKYKTNKSSVIFLRVVFGFVCKNVF